MCCVNFTGNTLRRRASDVERLRRDTLKRADKAFRYSGPGFCGVCDTRVHTALDAHMIACHLELGQLWRCPVEWCVVWKGSGRACLEHLAEKHGGSTLGVTTNIAKSFPPWTVTRDVWHAALRRDVSGVAVDPLLFHEARRRLVHRYRAYKDPFPHPALRDGVIPRLLSCVCRAMAIARLTHLKISIPSSGAPPGQVSAECFPGGTPLVTPSLRRRVSFADEVTMLGDEDSPECSPVLPPLIFPVVVEEVVDVPEPEALPSLILPVVEEFNSSAPVVTRVDLVPIATGSGLPPPPGFSPFVWPVDDGVMDVDDLCVQIGGDCSLTFSPIGLMSSDVSDAAGSSEEGVLISPSADSSSEMTPAVGYARLPLPRWQLALEGPFLEERSPESIRLLGPGCAFRNTTYRASDYAAPVGDYGFPLHHPRFVEWIGVPVSRAR